MGKLLPEVTERRSQKTCLGRGPDVLQICGHDYNTLFQDVHINCGDYNSIEMIVQKS